MVVVAEAKLQGVESSWVLPPLLFLKYLITEALTVPAALCFIRPDFPDSITSVLAFRKRAFLVELGKWG